MTTIHCIFVNKNYKFRFWDDGTKRYISQEMSEKELREELFKEYSKDDLIEKFDSQIKLLRNGATHIKLYSSNSEIVCVDYSSNQNVDLSRIDLPLKIRNLATSDPERKISESKLKLEFLSNIKKGIESKIDECIISVKKSGTSSNFPRVKNRWGNFLLEKDPLLWKSKGILRFEIEVEVALSNDEAYRKAFPQSFCDYNFDGAPRLLLFKEEVEQKKVKVKRIVYLFPKEEISTFYLKEYLNKYHLYLADFQTYCSLLHYYLEESVGISWESDSKFVSVQTVKDRRYYTSRSFELFYNKELCFPLNMTLVCLSHFDDLYEEDKTLQK